MLEAVSTVASNSEEILYILNFHHNHAMIRELY